MALTADQDIPKKPEIRESWTVRRLFPFAAVTSALSKTFTSPLYILLGYLVVILSLAEVFGRYISWFLWVLTLLIFFASIAEHWVIAPNKKEKKK